MKTTGIYCRPGCPSRLPRRDNVLFFTVAHDAEAAGFRACKRCQPNGVSPDGAQVETMTRICRFIEEAEEPASLQTLAQQAGLSPYHFQRLFKKIVGVTPKQYAAAHRAKQVRHHLQEHPTVTEAIYKSGFAASSTFYDQSTALLGMTHSQFRQGAPGTEMRVAICPCWLGLVLIAATAQGICAIALGDTAETLTAQLRADFPQAQFCQGDAAFETWVEQVICLIETPQAAADLPLDIQGTAFQRRVWQLLQTIPPGTTLSYGEVARQMGNPKAVRAVAQACARNPVAVAIPCHRVVGSDGSLKGYRWGRDRKQALLAKEATRT